MLEPCFNEWSEKPYCRTKDEMDLRVLNYVRLLKALQKYGIQKVRYEHGLASIHMSTDTTLYDYCEKELINRNQNSSKLNEINLLFSMVHRPYLQDSEENLFTKYSDVKLLLNTSQGVSEVDCLGAYAAFLLKSFVVGFKTKESDSNVQLKLIDSNCSNGEPKEQSASVLNITDSSNVANNVRLGELLSTQPNIGVFKVDKCSQTNTKKVNVAGHHGKNVCDAFGEMLKKDEYVRDIINSIDWKSEEKRFIHRINEDGTIEIRLHWTKKGYGIKISTSATDIVQAYWIAKHLQDKYDRT